MWVPKEPFLRVFAILPISGLLVGLFYACATVGVDRVPAAPDAKPFERGLMSYARGELEQAEQGMVEALEQNPYDLRASDLLYWIRREQGDEPEEPVAISRLTFQEPLTPEQILEITLGRNPEIRQAVFRIVEARARLREANVDFSPEFSILTRFYPLGIFASLTQSILGVLLEREARMHQAEELVLLTIAEYSRVRAEVLDRALVSYVDLLEAQDQLGPLKHELEVKEQMNRVATTLFDHGRLLPNEVLAIERSIAETEAELDSTRGRAVVARASLNSLMGRRTEEALRVTAKYVTPSMPESMQQGIMAARRNRPDLQEARMRVVEARAGQEVVSATELPGLELRGTYGVTSKEGRGDFLEGFSIGLRMRTPLLIWPLRQARTDREEAFVGQLEMEVKRLLGDVSVEVVDHYQALLSSQRALGVAYKREREADETVRIARSVEKWGEAGDPLAIAAARVQSAEAAREALAQEYTVLRNYLELQQAMGVQPEQIAFSESQPADHEYLGFQREPSKRKRALWVWRPEFLEHNTKMDYFLDFAEARDVEVFFIFTSTSRLRAHADRFRVFIRRARKRNMKVHALNGESHWIFPQKRHGAVAFMDEVAAYNLAAGPHERFDAIHLDVEPHVLADWKSTGREILVSRYVDFLTWAYERAGAEDLILAVDIPAWFDRISLNTGNLLDAVLSHTDQIVIMAYRDSREKIIRSCETEVGQAEAEGKGVWIGLSADPDHLPATSAGQLRASVFENMVVQVAEAFESKGSLLGMAIHDYDRYRLLLSGSQLLAGEISVYSERTVGESGLSIEPEGGSGPYWIRIASYKTDSALSAQQGLLERSGYRARVEEVEIPGRGRWRRLYVGAYSSQVEAQEALSRMRAKGLGQGAIIERIEMSDHEISQD